MARLGELLVAAGLLTVEQAEQALRAQVMWGGRFGTNLIELGFIDLDALSRALGRQHRLPAALGRHFEKVDRELQLLLSADVAERFGVVPLIRVGPDRKVIVVSTDPLGKKPLAIVADELAVEPSHLIPSIAAELRIRYQLERIYQIPRTARFMRAPGKSVAFATFEVSSVTPDSDPEIRLPTDTAEIVALVPPTADADLTIPVQRKPAALIVDDADDPDLSIASDAHTLPVHVERAPTADPVVGETVELDDFSMDVAFDDDLAVPTAVVEETPSGRERRTYIRTLNEPARADPDRAALGRIAIRKVAIAPAPQASDKTLADAMRAIRRGIDRDKVAELIVDAVSRFVPGCEAIVILVVRGEVAISWKGFVRSGGSPPEVAVPMKEPGLVPRAVVGKCTARAPSDDLTPVDALLMVSLEQDGGELSVVPVMIASRVLCVMAIVTAGNTESTIAEAIATAAGAAFARLMRDAGR